MMSISLCQRKNTNRMMMNRSLVVRHVTVIFIQSLLLFIISMSTNNNMIHATMDQKEVSKTHSHQRHQSFRRILHNDNDGTLLSRTALIDKAIEFNSIIKDYNHRRRSLYTTDTFNISKANDYTGTTTGSSSGADEEVYTEDRVNDVCRLIESSFHIPTNDSTTSGTEPVSCRCMGALHGTLSINCDYSMSICTEPTDVTTTTTRSSDTSSVVTNNSATATCGKPQLGVTMVRGYVFSATTCISQYRRGLVEIPDTCVFVNTCEDMNSNTFCDCTASHNGSICNTCTICNGGKSMSVDCTNININSISTTCQPIDLDLDLNNGAGQILGFIPEFNNNDNTVDVSTDGNNNETSSFCTELESYLDNDVTCDCHNMNNNALSALSTSIYEIKCSTNQMKCDSNNINCGIVSSSIQIVNGQLNPNIMATCTKYPEPLGETCTTIDYCNTTTTTTTTTTTIPTNDGIMDDINNDITTTTTTTSQNDTISTSTSQSLVCGCSVTYNGYQCNSCNICNDGNGIQFDCSNVNEYAYSGEQCQIITRSSSYEYVPLFATVPNMNNKTTTSPPPPNNNNNTPDASTTTKTTTSGGSSNSHMVMSYYFFFMTLVMGSMSHSMIML